MADTPPDLPAKDPPLFNPIRSTTYELTSCSLLDKARAKQHHVALCTRARNAYNAPLTSLPLELLDMILDFAIPQRRVLIFASDKTLRPRVLPLLQVCHALRDPATLIWLAKTEFHVRGISKARFHTCGISKARYHPGGIPKAQNGDRSEDLFWSFCPKRALKDVIEPRYMKYVECLLWDPVAGSRLHGLPDKAMLEAAEKEAGLRKGALHVPCEIYGRSYWCGIEMKDWNKAVDLYTIFVMKYLGKKFRPEAGFRASHGVGMNKPVSIRWYTPWGWHEDSEKMRDADVIAVHVSSQNWVVMVQHMDRYSKVDWADARKPPFKAIFAADAIETSRLHGRLGH